MSENILVFSLRRVDRNPAMACVVEFEDVLTREFGAERIDYPAAIPSSSRYSMIFCIGLHFDHLFMIRKKITTQRMRGAKIVAYIFDCWNVKEYFYNKNRIMKAKLFSDISILSFCDRLFVPFEAAKEAFREPEKSIVRYLPLGVDTTLSHGKNRERSISVFAYGRQIPEYDEFLSDNFNKKGGGYLYYNTSHMNIAGINDFHAHRRLFWKLAENSAVALAFDPSAARKDVPYSFVGQRWFECLAAGCVVAGKRPAALDTDDLLSWENATIDLPATPQGALKFLKELLADKEKLAEIRERNVTEVTSRHDWTHRINYMLSDML